MNASTELSRKVRDRADRDGLADDHPLRDLADKFDAAWGAMGTESFDAKRVLGSWARLRRAWCDYSGEPLL